MYLCPLNKKTNNKNPWNTASKRLNRAGRSVGAKIRPIGSRQMPHGRNSTYSICSPIRRVPVCT